MPAVDTEAVLRFIKTRGPVIPVQIAKEINSNLMMAGAVLSEMVSSGKLRVSKVKIGGSPLYYAIGQENRLTGFTQHLGSKERATYDALRQAGVIQDRATDALTRVTLRAIKDFAIPLTVTLNGQQEIFWKYFLISDSEAETKIKSLLGMEETKIPPTEQSENNHPQIRGSIEPRPMPQLKPQKPFVSGDEYDDEKPARTQQATIFEAASRSTPIPDTAASEKAVSAPVKDAEQPKEGKTPLQTEDPQIEKSPRPKENTHQKTKTGSSIRAEGGESNRSIFNSDTTDHSISQPSRRIPPRRILQKDIRVLRGQFDHSGICHMQQERQRLRPDNQDEFADRRDEHALHGARQTISQPQRRQRRFRAMPA